LKKEAQTFEEFTGTAEEAFDALLKQSAAFAAYVGSLEDAGLQDSTEIISPGSSAIFRILNTSCNA